jgi:hypothetical protein
VIHRIISGPIGLPPPAQEIDHIRKQAEKGCSISVVGDEVQPGIALSGDVGEGPHEIRCAAGVLCRVVWLTDIHTTRPASYLRSHEEKTPDPIYSDLSPTLRRTILELPTLSITQGFWERAGLLRAKVIRTGRRANLADTLIAQSCLDRHATLVTRDRDFKAFVSAVGLRVAIPYS